MSTLKVTNIQQGSASSAAITLATDGTCTANITNNLSNRNKIINGGMTVSQRQTSRTGTGGGDGYFLCDRWRIYSANTSARFTISQASDTSVTTGLPSSFKFDCTTADTSLAASDYLGIQQKIEGQNVQDFLKGTSNAKKFTLSFYVKTNKSGVYTVELKDNDNSRQISKTFTVSDGNWNRYTISYPADTTGVFGNDNGDSLQVNFWLIAGSTYTGGTLNSSGWASQTNANRVSSSNVNIGDSTDNNFELTGLQLEVDHTGSGVATDFEHRSYAQELALCQRYYFEVARGDDKVIGLCMFYNDTGVRTAIRYPVQMRTTPSIETSNSTGHFACLSGDGSGSGSGTQSSAFATFDTSPAFADDNAIVIANTVSDNNQNGQAGYIATQHADAYLCLSAEL